MKMLPARILQLKCHQICMLSKRTEWASREAATLQLESSREYCEKYLYSERKQ